MAGNRSRFSKHLMTGSPVFSINLTYLRIPANPNYHMSASYVDYEKSSDPEMLYRSQV